MQVVNAVRTVSALANGADPGDVIKDYAISTAASYLGGQLGGAVFGGGLDRAGVSTRGADVTAGNKDKVTAFVGGARDKCTRIVKDIFEDVRGPNDAYFQHNQGIKLGNWIDANANNHVRVFGHSWEGRYRNACDCKRSLC